MLNGSYAERVPEQPRPASRRPLPSCRVRIEKIADTRGSPELLGVVAGRAVRAPADVDAWLRNVLRGLETRSVHAVFAEESAAGSELRVNFELQLASVTNIRANKSANVQFIISYPQGTAPGESKAYRGMAAGTNWASGDGELQRLVDHAFSDALDRVASDLLGRCAALG